MKLKSSKEYYLNHVLSWCLIILNNKLLIPELLFHLKFWLFCSHYSLDAIKLQLVESGLVECLLEIVQQKVDSDKEEDIAELKTASDLMVLLLLGGEL